MSASPSPEEAQISEAVPATGQRPDLNPGPDNVRVTSSAAGTPAGVSEAQTFHDFLQDRESSPLKKYQRLVIGNESLAALVWHELLTFFLTWMPGLPGLFLRQKTYGKLFSALGRGVTFGQGVQFRQASKIEIGDRVIVDDQVVLNVRGGKTSGITVGAECYIGRATEIKANDGRVLVNESSSIGSHCRIAIQEGTIQIGRDVFVAAYCYIGGGNHRYERTDIPIAKQGFVSRGGVTIGDDVWIGSNSVIADGVTIGKGAIVGTFSYVNKDIPPYAIAYGSPARVHRSRLDDPSSGQ